VAAPDLRPPEVEIGPPREGDPRIGHLLGRELEGGEPPRAVLVGFPTDEGVRRNEGRRGAAEGPIALRRSLYGMTPDPRPEGRMRELLVRTRDLGDLAVTGHLERDQRRLAGVLAPHLARGAFAIVLGGGHETAYAHFLAHVEAGLRPRILNWDAHPDVRPLRNGRGHSGSPFRQALEHPSGACRGYRVVGLLRHATARAHLRYLESAGASWAWREEVEGGPEDGDRVAAARVERERGAGDPVEAEYAPGEPGAAPTLVSFDLDAVDRSAAPGVSAPATGGLSVETWLRAARGAGLCPHVDSADVVELNPRYDPDGRTAALAALTVWRILEGLSGR